MKKKTRITILLTTLLLLFAFAMPASAASTKTKALKAYRKFLEKEKDNLFYQYFGIAYINNDSVPELVAYGLGGKPTICYYKNGKVKKLWSAANCYYSHYYKKKGVVKQTAYRPEEWDYYGYVKVNLAKNKSSILSGYSDGKYENSKNKTISKKQFNNILKKAVGKTKASKIKYYKNTAANRKKYLK